MVEQDVIGSVACKVSDDQPVGPIKGLRAGRIKFVDKREPALPIVVKDLHQLVVA